MHRLSLGLAGLIVLLSAAAVRADPIDRGTLILEGGGPSASGFAASVVDGLPPGNGTLCIITTAMDGMAHDAEIGRFAGHGVPVDVLDIDARNIDDRTMLARLGGCAGYYFTGGDPELLSEVWRPRGRPTEALRLVRRRYEEAGAVISGSSAGAMIVGEVTLCECGAGSSVQALLDDRLFEAAGFGLVGDVLVDAHFFARGLLGRHLWQMVHRGHPVGVGIDEATAVVVPGDGGSWRVTGDRGVALIRTMESDGGGPARFRISLLAPGDRFVPATGEVRVAEERRPLDRTSQTGAAPLDIADIFARNAVPLLLVDLVSEPAGRAIGRAAGGAIKLVFEETPETRAFSDGHHTTVLDVALTLDVR